MHNAIMIATFAVVVVQGLTMPAPLRWLALLFPRKTRNGINPIPQGGHRKPARHKR
jgi:hypothetical protein